jgi:S-layer protein
MLNQFVPAAGSSVDALSNLFNSVYIGSVGNAATTDVAIELVKNVGIVTGSNGLTASQVADAVTYVKTQLDAVTFEKRGAVIQQILNDFATLASTDNVYKAAATTWNASVDNAIVYAANNTANALAGTAASQIFVLSWGIDTVSGTAGNDTIKSPNDGGGLTALDNIDGGAGTDTLNVTDTNPINVPSSAIVKNVEAANLISGTQIEADTSGWIGLTALTTSSGMGGQTLTAAATTAVTANAATVGGFGVTVDGGAAVTVVATGVTTGGITVGGTTAPTGAVTVNSAVTGASAANDIVVNGGTAVSVSQSTANAGATAGEVIITGGASTVSASAVHTATVVGATNEAVTVNDANFGAASKASTIASVTASGYTNLSVGSNALTTLSVANGSGNIIIDNQATDVVTKTLNATVNNLTGGTLDDADNYTKLNVTTTGANSTLANVTFGALTDLSVSGTKALTLTSTAGATALKTVTVTGTAGLSASVAQASVTAVDTSGTTGTSTITLDATKATFTGGAGKDNVTTSAAAPTKAIALGDGDDSLTLASGTTTVTGAITGGAGTDTLSMVAADAVTASGSATFAGKVTGFEALTLTGATGKQDVDLAVLGAYNKVTSNASAGTLTLNNLASGGTLTITGDTAGTGYVANVTSAAVNKTDSLNLVLSKAGLLAAGTVTAANVETVNITTADTQTTPTNPLDTLTLEATSATTVTVAGNAGLNLSGVTDVALTSLDASGITAGSFTFTAGALTAAAAIKGSATGTNTVTFSAAVNGAVTYTGGTGNDVVTASNGKNNVIDLGDGTNSVTGAAGNNTITGGTGADTVTLTTGNNVVNLGNGTNAFTATTGNNTYVGGTGVDTISVGAGVNTITTGTGADVVTITTAGANVNVYSTITDAHAGMQIAFTNLGTETFVSSKVSLASTAVFQDYANAVVAGATQADHSQDGAFGWFQFGGNTFLVEVKHTTAGGINQTFSNGVDQIVCLTGLVDLSTATGGTTNILTLA